MYSVMSERKRRQLAAVPRGMPRLTNLYNTCALKRHWKELTKEEWIEACQELYEELDRDSKAVRSFGPWEKALLETFLITPHCWQFYVSWPNVNDVCPLNKCRSIIPDLIRDMKHLPSKKQKVKDMEKRIRTLKRRKKAESGYLHEPKDREDWERHMAYTGALLNHPRTLQWAINSIFTDRSRYYAEDIDPFLYKDSTNEIMNSLLAQEEAKAVLGKFKFRQGFTLQDSCVVAIRDTVWKHGTEYGYSTAVDTLPVPELVKNIIDPVRTSRFESANCPMYKLLASFAKGQWLHSPLRFENILGCKEAGTYARKVMSDSSDYTVETC